MRTRLALAMTVMILFTACGSTDDAALESGAPAEDGPPAVLAFGEPAGEVVLTVVGASADPNAGDRIELDLAMVEDIGTITTTLYEPFVSESIEFTGVPVDALLGALGVPDDAPLRWVALDDYEVNPTRAELAAEGALLATRQDGELLEIAAGGPLRIVFPDDSGPLGRDTNQWIWSVVLLEAG